MIALQGGEEGVEAGVFLPISIGKGRVDDCRIEINDPRLLAGHAAGLLRAERSAMEAALVTHNADFLFAADCEAVCPSKFNRALGCLGTSGQQKDLIESWRRHACEAFGQFGPLF